MNNYSIDMLKKAAFQNEIVSLNCLPVEFIDENILIVTEYLENRIKEIDKIHK